MLDFLGIVMARAGSERLPGKVLADINGRPLLAGLLERVRPLAGSNGKIVVLTTTAPADNPIEVIAKKTGLECYRHEHPTGLNDVTGAIAGVVAKNPAKLIMRILGDCPFLAIELVERAKQVLWQTRREVFLWHIPPTVWPVYGSREFPMSNAAWEKIIARAAGDEREHPDLYFNRHRESFSIVYHDPPPEVYFRHPYRLRLEVDWPEDVELVQAVDRLGPGLVAPLPDIIRWLDKHDKIAALNRQRVEKTGPVVSYNPDLQRQWYKLMNAAEIITWDNKIIKPLDEKRAGQICCRYCGQVLGWGWLGSLYLRANYGGHHINQGRIKCLNCGGVRVWQRESGCGDTS